MNEIEQMMKSETTVNETIRVEDLTFGYPKREPVLKKIRLSAAAGEIVGVTGLSGSGKTTLLHCVSGVIPHVSGGRPEGSVFIGGENLAEISLAAISQHVGVVFQDPDNRMVATTAEDEIAFSLGNMCFPPEQIRRRVEEILRLFRMEHLRERNPESLSGGEKQMLSIASVLAADPPVIVMDEPLSHLDRTGKQLVNSLIAKLREMGKTILSAEHDFYNLSFADRILFLEKGVIAREGPPEEMIPFLERHFSEESVSGESISRNNVLGKTVSGKTAKTASRKTVCEKAVTTRILSKRGTAGGAAGTQSESLGNRAVEVKNLSFSYGSGKYGFGKPVLEDFSASFRAGEIAALTGRNGCGKSTLVRNIAGLLRPSAGEIFVDGAPASQMSIAQIAEHVGLVMQNPYCQMLGMTVREEMEAAMKNREMAPEEIEERVLFYLDYFDLTAYEKEFPGHLSMGEKQRLEMAAVMAAGADYLILDEPTASLDMKRRRRLGHLLQTLAEDGKGVLLVSHDERFHGEYADRIICMDRTDGAGGAADAYDVNAGGEDAICGVNAGDSAGGMNRADSGNSAGSVNRADSVNSAGSVNRADSVNSAGGMNRADFGNSAGSVDTDGCGKGADFR